MVSLAAIPYSVRRQRIFQTTQGLVENYGQLLGKVYHIRCGSYSRYSPRRKMALGSIRGGVGSWGVLLPLMVRSNGI